MSKATEASDPGKYIRTMILESDRGCLLVGLAQLDKWLKELLLFTLSRQGGSDDADWLLDEKAGDRPLGALAIRTRIARCLGVITVEMRNVIDSIRKLRNNHAHGIDHFVLSDDDVQPILNSFSEINKSLTIDLANRAKTLELSKELTDPRRQLMATFSMVASVLESELMDYKNDASGSNAS